MRLSGWGHACVRIEQDGRALVIDPGAYSDVAGAMVGAQAVLVTHVHGDHVVPEGLAAAASAGVDVWGPEPVLTALRTAGAPSARLHEVAAGAQIQAAGMPVQVMGEWHAAIHPDVPRDANVGYLVAGLVFHPGDAFIVPDVPVPVLLEPVGGPWMKLAESVDHVRAVHPRLVIPVHDAVLSGVGQQLADQVVGRLAGAPAYRRLASGEGITVEDELR